MRKATSQEMNDSPSTSYHFKNIITTPTKLIEKLGEPQMNENYGDDKVNMEWNLISEDGTFFTLYDWKEYSILKPNSKYEWHIGTKTEEESSKVLHELSAFLIK